MATLMLHSVSGSRRSDSQLPDSRVCDVLGRLVANEELPNLQAETSGWIRSLGWQWSVRQAPPSCRPYISDQFGLRMVLLFAITYPELKAVSTTRFAITVGGAH
jgi:hypothetical protein